MEEQNPHGRGPAQPPAAWYPDPVDSSEGRMRYWDGADWTDHYAARRRSSTLAWVASAALLALPAALIGIREREQPAAELVGFILGGPLFALAIAFLIRAVYVKLFAKSERIVSPWLLVIAAAILFMSFAGNVSRDGDGGGFSKRTGPVVAHLAR